MKLLSNQPSGLKAACNWSAEVEVAELTNVVNPSDLR